MNMDPATRKAFEERMQQASASAGHVRAQHPMAWRHPGSPGAPRPATPQHLPPWDPRRTRQFGDAADIMDPADAAAAPPPLPTTLPAAGAKVPASQALAFLQARYATLAKQGARLRALGPVVPCNVVETYSRAVNSYLKDGIDLFKQIQAQGGSVEQVVFDSNGEPQKDANGNFVSQAVTTPLLPPFPIVDVNKCPSYLPFAQQLNGALRGAHGLGQVVPPSAILGALRAAWPFIVRLGTFIITSIAISSLLDKIMVIWRGYDPAPAKAVDAYLECVAKLQAGGVSAQQAAAQCGGIVPRQGMSTFAWIGVFTVVAATAGGVAYYFFKKTSPAERERRERITQAEREAEEAQQAAQAARMRARRYRAGHITLEPA